MKQIKTLITEHAADFQFGGGEEIVKMMNAPEKVQIYYKLDHPESAMMCGLWLQSEFFDKEMKGVCISCHVPESSYGSYILGMGIEDEEVENIDTNATFAFFLDMLDQFLIFKSGEKMEVTLSPNAPTLSQEWNQLERRIHDFYVFYKK